MDDREFRHLLDLLNLSWQGYARVKRGVKKRLRRRLRELGIGIDACLARVKEDEEFRREAERTLSVPISRFFRDADLWNALERDVIPEILADPQEEVRVWFAGCAMGQEVYSFKMVWMTLDGQAALPVLVIRATDLNPILLEKARRGIYPAGCLEGMDPGRKDRFFRPVSSRLYAVSDGLKSGIDWKIHNVAADPISGKFQIVFLRNSLLTYYKASVQVAGLSKLLKSLAEGGFLVIGRKEVIPRGVAGLVPFSRNEWILRKERNRN